MAEPTIKSFKINNFIDSFLGHGRVDSIKNDVCAWCGKPVGKFKDELSKKEYSISGLCQQCQDKTFS